MVDSPGMKRAVISLVLLAAAAATVSCRVRDVRTATIRVPGLRDETALREVEVSLRKLPDSRISNRRGNVETCFKVLSADFETGDLTLRYDSMKVGVKNLEEAISLAGYDTPSFPAAKPPRP